MFIKYGFLIDESGIQDHQMEDYTPKELRSEWESQGGIRPTEAGLERIDYILPRLLNRKPVGIEEEQ
jgi:oxygen-independent coproporphyrinogen-3 oxidase